MLTSFNSRTNQTHPVHQGCAYVTVGISPDRGGVEVHAYSASGQCSSACFIKHGVGVGSYVEKAIAELVSEAAKATQVAVGQSVLES
jgi:hypothetical protein